MPRTPRYERAPEVVPEDQDSILGWAGRHPILSGLLLTGGVAGGLALGTNMGWFATLPWLNQAGQWVIQAGSWFGRHANTLLAGIMTAMGIKSMAQGQPPAPDSDPRLTHTGGQGLPHNVSPPRP
jgi:hypothetical protein